MGKRYPFGNSFSRTIRKGDWTLKMDDASVIAILKSSGAAAAVEAAAKEVATRARANAPADTGEYREGIEVVVQEHRLVVVAQVVATAPHSLAVEARTGNLRRALGG